MDEKEVIRKMNNVITMMDIEGFTVMEQDKKNILDILEGRRTCDEIVAEIIASHMLTSQRHTDISIEMTDQAIDE